MALVGQFMAPSVATPAPSGVGEFTRWAVTGVPDLLRRFDVPSASVAIVDDGDIAWTGDFGRGGRADRPDEVYEVASLSKTVTALAVLRLVDQGRLALDDPVNSRLKRWHVPASTYDVSAVTVRGLLSHTAGIATSEAPNMPLGAPRPSIEDVLDGRTPVHAAVLDHEPNTAFAYSNPGYGVLELLIEDVTGKPFDAAVRELVFDPLGLERTGFQDDAIYGRALRGHSKGDRTSPAYRRVPRAAGGVVSSASDMARLAVAVVAPVDEGGLLTRASLEAMTAPSRAADGAFATGHDGGYALGIAVGRLPSRRRFVANEGSHEGYSSILLAVPATRSAVVVLTNSNAGLAAELEIGIRWFRDTVGELPTIVARADTIRRIVRAASIVVTATGVVAAVYLGRDVRRRRRVPSRRPRLRPAITTAVPLGAIAAALSATNLNLLGDAVGGVPPSRLVSADFPALSLATAAVLAANAAAVVFTRRRPEAAG